MGTIQRKHPAWKLEEASHNGLLVLLFKRQQNGDLAIWDIALRTPNGSTFNLMFELTGVDKPETTFMAELAGGLLEEKPGYEVELTYYITMDGRKILKSGPDITEVEIEMPTNAPNAESHKMFHPDPNLDAVERSEIINALEVKTNWTTNPDWIDWLKKNGHSDVIYVNETLFGAFLKAKSRVESNKEPSNG